MRGTTELASHISQVRLIKSEDYDLFRRDTTDAEINARIAFSGCLVKSVLSQFFDQYKVPI